MWWWMSFASDACRPLEEPFLPSLVDLASSLADLACPLAVPLVAVVDTELGLAEEQPIVVVGP